MEIMLNRECSATAVGELSYLRGTAFSFLWQCSGTSVAMQFHCGGYAVLLQRDCIATEVPQFSRLAEKVLSLQQQTYVVKVFSHFK